MTELADSLKPPYWAVVFSSKLREPAEGYEEAAMRMIELAREQPGFLGFESARGEDGLGVTISYWESEEAIAAWRAHAEHRAIQRLGREEWYAAYRLRVGRIERDVAGPPG